MAETRWLRIEGLFWAMLTAFMIWSSTGYWYSALAAAITACCAVLALVRAVLAETKIKQDISVVRRCPDCQRAEQLSPPQEGEGR